MISQHPWFKSFKRVIPIMVDFSKSLKLWFESKEIVNQFNECFFIPVTHIHDSNQLVNGKKKPYLQLMFDLNEPYAWFESNFKKFCFKISNLWFKKHARCWVWPTFSNLKNTLTWIKILFIECEGEWRYSFN